MPCWLTLTRMSVCCLCTSILFGAVEGWQSNVAGVTGAAVFMLLNFAGSRDGADADEALVSDDEEDSFDTVDSDSEVWHDLSWCASELRERGKALP
jgi:hypothetical protein